MTSAALFTEKIVHRMSYRISDTLQLPTDKVNFIKTHGSVSAAKKTRKN